MNKPLNTPLMLLAAVLALSTQTPASAQGKAPGSGLYEHVMLAVSPSGRLEGVYNDPQTVGGVRKRCYFLMAGQASAAGAKVTTWGPLPPVLSGTISAQDTGISLTIPKGPEHPGCAQLLPASVNTGLQLNQLRATEWIGLQQVMFDQVILFEDPSGTVPHKRHPRRNDIVGVLVRNGDWLQIEYPAIEGEMVRGWIRTSDTAPLGRDH